MESRFAGSDSLHPSIFSNPNERLTWGWDPAATARPSRCTGACMPASFAAAASDAIPIHGVTPVTVDAVLEGLPPSARAFAAASGFDPKPGRHLVLPGADGAIAAYCSDWWRPRSAASIRFFPVGCPLRCPRGITGSPGRGPRPRSPRSAGRSPPIVSAGTKAGPVEGAVLCLPPDVDEASLARTVEAVTLRARPRQHAGERPRPRRPGGGGCWPLAGRHGAETRVVRGEALREGFPLIHAVGLAAAEPPRLVDLTWGAPDAPMVTLGRQGRHLRHRRPRHQARERDGG